MSRNPLVPLSVGRGFLTSSQLQQPGAYIAPPHSARTTGAAAAGTLHMVPVFIAKSCTADVIGFEQTAASAAGGVARCGIWAPFQGTGSPDKLLYGSSTIALDGANGAKEFSSIGVHLNAGLYWLGTVQQVQAATLRTINTAGVLVAMIDTTAPTGTGVGGAGYTKTGMTGALTDIGGISGTTPTPTITWIKLL